jgi:hypothetical protein
MLILPRRIHTHTHTSIYKAETIKIHKIAWDKPTDKSMALLSKHYNLCNFVHNPNNFVVFDEYFA